MGLSKGAKRGIAIFNHIQSSPKNRPYHEKKMTMTIDLNKVDQPIVDAGLAAIQKMRENADAIQKLSNSKENTIQADAQGRTEHSVPVQPEAGQEGTEGKADGTPGGAK